MYLQAMTNVTIVGHKLSWEDAIHNVDSRAGLDHGCLVLSLKRGNKSCIEVNEAS